jgi:hypothetical protein
VEYAWMQWASSTAVSGRPQRLSWSLRADTPSSAVLVLPTQLSQAAQRLSRRQALPGTLNWLSVHVKHTLFENGAHGDFPELLLSSLAAVSAGSQAATRAMSTREARCARRARCCLIG